MIKKTMWLACGVVGVFATSLLGAGDTPVIDNDEVVVRDITLAPGTSGAMVRHAYDFVTMFLTGGDIRTTDAKGKANVATHQAGDALFGRKGTEEKLEVTSASPARLVVIDLKDHRVPALPNNTKLPNAFPRPGSKKILENDRVIVWNYTWMPGVPTPMHYHDKDVVVAYRYDGSLKSTTPSGEVVVNDYKFGTIRFNKADRSHTEELVKGQQSAIMMELK